MRRASALSQRLQNEELQHKACQERQQRAYQQRKPERACLVGNNQSEVSAHREERAVGQIEDVHQSEDQRKADREQEHQHA